MYATSSGGSPVADVPSGAAPTGRAPAGGVPPGAAAVAAFAGIPAAAPPPVCRTVPAAGAGADVPYPVFATACCRQTRSSCWNAAKSLPLPGTTVTAGGAGGSAAQPASTTTTPSGSSLLTESTVDTFLHVRLVSTRPVGSIWKFGASCRHQEDVANLSEM
jgi:hypothetical protein